VKILIISEKPSVASDIANALGKVEKRRIILKMIGT